MGHAVIRQSKPAEFFIIGIEDDIIFAFRDEEAVVGEGFGRREIEDEDEVTSHIREDLICIVMPYFANGEFFDVRLRLDNGEHFAVEVPELMIAQFLIIQQIPLTPGILMRPSVTFAREVNPFGVTEFIPHEVEVTAVAG